MFSFNNDTPIYLQIVDLIRNDISSGKLKPGQKLPSVREYALEFKVNPNTICKAMQILEDKKIIYTRANRWRGPPDGSRPAPRDSGWPEGCQTGPSPR